jgi:molybdopterin converting factor small subunit
MATIEAPPDVAGDAPTDGVEVEGRTVGDVFESHAEEHGPELLEAVTDGRSLASHVDVYVDGEGVRRQRGLATPVDADSTIRIVPRLYQG